ncbi:hypothetical protein [Syntrophobotulus glycolicus]|uniref:hypothetical protein n=1 Tax=Syntrophobotulus glycolicus TaxID=51197 RepID=UPI0003025C40|nr:hypothetical protein [Syntrophobotulus glycolicus]
MTVSPLAIRSFPASPSPTAETALRFFVRGSVNDLSQISAWQVVFYFDPRARLDMGVLDATLKIGMGLTPKEDII